MILRAADRLHAPDDGPGREGMGHVTEARLADAGGLTQFGANIVTLAPGARSSDRHWHAAQDELLLVVSGEATVVDDAGAHTLAPGDAVCWPAGRPNAHRVENRSALPCRFLVVGTHAEPETIHYPDHGRRLEIGAGRWRMLDATGATLSQGEIG